MSDVSELLRRINILTKYPSIPTYHPMGERGRLQETSPVAFPKGTVWLTEKVDGTNCRLICLPPSLALDAWVVGSREQLLWGSRDLIYNPALGIVEHLKPHCARLCAELGHRGHLSTIYLECFGGRTSAAARQYTGGEAVGFRVLDVAFFPDYREQLQGTAAELSSWRDQVGPEYVPFMELENGVIPRVPGWVIPAQELPITLQETLDFIRDRLPVSICPLDREADGRPEGLVLRTSDRRTIAKARLQDYKAALK